MRLRSGRRMNYNPRNGLTRRTTFRGSSSYSSRRGPTARPAGVRSGQGVTVQHDARQIYRRRRMPRRKRKVWKRFLKKVHAVSEKDLGSRMVVFNVSAGFTNTTLGNQGVAYCALYSVKSGDSFMTDMNNLSGLENVGNPTAALGSTVYDTTKWLFQSAILDVTFRNTSGIWSSSGTVNTLTSEAKLEVDVYELISGKEWNDQLGAKGDPLAVFNEGADMQPNIGGAGTAAVLGLRGVTPWEFPAALGYYRVKILKKTKYFVNNGDTFTYQIRDPRRRVIYQERMEQALGGNMPRWTRHVLILFKLVPGLTVGSTDGTYRESLTCGITRKYFYKIEGVSEDRDRYLPNT